MTCLDDADLVDLIDRPEGGNAHLRDCPDCQLRRAELAIATRMLSELRPVPAVGRPVSWILRLELAAAAALLLGVTGYALWTGRDPMPAPGRSEQERAALREELAAKKLELQNTAVSKEGEKLDIAFAEINGRLYQVGQVIAGEGVTVEKITQNTVTVSYMGETRELVIQDAAAAAREQEAARAELAKITTLIDQLGAAGLEERQAASDRLARLGSAAVGALRGRQDDPDPEIRGNVASILSLLEGAREYRVLRQHSSYVTALAFSPDGSVLVSGGWDGKVLFWSTRTFDLQATLDLGDHAQVHALRYSPDGTILACAYGGTVVLWASSTREKLASLEGGAEVLFDRGGTRIFTLGKDERTIKAWDLKSLKELRTYEGHSGRIHCLALSEDDRFLASGGDYSEERVRVWDVATGREVKSLTGHTYAIFNVLFPPGGGALVSEGPSEWRSHSINPSQLKIWNTDTWEQTGTLPGDSVSSMACSRDGRILILGTHAAQIVGWEWKTGRRVFASSFSAPKASQHSAGTVSALTLSPDQELLVSGDYDCAIRVWCVGSRLLRPK